jgi:hypothetical protein
MASGTLRVAGVAPAGDELRQFLTKWAEPGTIVSSYDDAKLLAVSALCPEVDDVEFLSFGELTGRMANMAGISTLRLAGRAQQRTATLAALGQVEHPMVRKGVAQDGLAGLLAERIHELEQWEYTSDDLDSIAQEASPTLKRKLDLLYETSLARNDLLGTRQSETVTGRLNRLLEAGTASDVPFRRLVVFVGLERRPLYERWLKTLPATGLEVVVAVDWAGAESPLFAPSRAVANCLEREVEFSGGESWWSALFTGRTAEKAPAVAVHVSGDPYAECEWSLRESLEALSEDELPHRQAFFSRDSTTYAPLLSANARRLGFPLQVVLSEELLNNGFAHLVLTLLKVLAEGDVRGLAKVAASTYLPFSVRPGPEFADMLRACYRKGEAQWESLLEEAERDETLEWLKLVCDWRHRATQDAAPFGEWVGRMRALVGETGLAAWAASPESPTNERDLRAQTALQRSLADYLFALPNPAASLTLGDFVAIAERVWGEETVTYRNRSVSGASFHPNTASLRNPSRLWVLGMLEGTLPRRRREDPVLLDFERQEIARLAPERVPLLTSLDEARAERDEMARLCSAATRSLVFTYPKAEGDRDNIPAFYLSEVERCVGAVARREYPRKALVPEPERMKAQADVRLDEALKAGCAIDGVEQLTDDVERVAVQPKGDEPIVPEALAAATECPFRSVAKYQLKVRPPRRFSPYFLLTDLPVRANLIVASDPKEAKVRLGQALEKLAERLYGEVEPWEMEVIRRLAERLSDEWIEREFRARELWPRRKVETKPVTYELATGPRPISLKGEKVFFEPTRFGAGKYTAEEYASTLLFEINQPEYDSNREVFGTENVEAHARQTFFLMTLVHESRVGALEIDSMDGQRHIYISSPDRPLQLPRDGENYRVHDLAATGKIFRPLFETLSAGYEALKTAHMKAEQGAHCERCDYGELCRNHVQYGEQPDPFRGDP